MTGVFDHEPVSDEEVDVVGHAAADELHDALRVARSLSPHWWRQPEVIVAYLAYGRLALRLREEVGERESWES